RSQRSPRSSPPSGGSQLCRRYLAEGFSGDRADHPLDAAGLDKRGAARRNEATPVQAATGGRTMLQKSNPFMREANLIGGKWVQADSGATLDVTNPANGQKLGTVPKSGRAETRRAIEAAQAAFETFRRTTALERSRLLRKPADAIMDNQQALAELLTMEQGKSLAEAKGEIASSAAYVMWFAEEARRTYGDVVPSPWADRRILVTREPVGVIAAITPCNFPS